MSFITEILNNYSQFFSWDAMQSVLLDPKSWGIIFTLIVLEGLLSADNALVLAMMVRHLPNKLQKKALTYGIWGAYIFRFIAIGIGTYLIKIWWVKLIAAAYLLYMAFEFFKHSESESEEEAKSVNKSFWATVLTVELMDIAFSIDSVTAAFGVSNEIWVLFLGAIFGILMMRGVAKIFVALINKVPELESGAYVLIAIIGFKMVIETFNVEVPDWLFFGLMVVVFGGTFAVHSIKNKKKSHHAS